jgi:hypothetical protein
MRQRVHGVREIDSVTVARKSRIAPADVLVCERCGGPVRVIAAIQEPQTVEKILNYLGLPAKPPPVAPARYEYRSISEYF